MASSRHSSITQEESSSSDSDTDSHADSDDNSMLTQAQTDQTSLDNESSEFLTPTNRRRATSTQQTIQEESTIPDDDDNDTNNLQIYEPPKRMKSISITRRRTNSTKYTQSVSDEESESEHQTYEIYGGEPPISLKEKNNKKEKQKEQRKKGVKAAICILFFCLLIVVIIVFAMYWYENPKWYHPTSNTKPIGDPELEIDPAITANPTYNPSSVTFTQYQVTQILFPSTMKINDK